MKPPPSANLSLKSRKGGTLSYHQPRAHEGAVKPVSRASGLIKQKSVAPVPTGRPSLADLKVLRRPSLRVPVRSSQIPTKISAHAAAAEVEDSLIKFAIHFGGAYVPLPGRSGLVDVGLRAVQTHYACPVFHGYLPWGAWAQEMGLVNTAGKVVWFKALKREGRHAESLIEADRKAMLQFRFKPLLVHGKPTSFYIVSTAKFRAYHPLPPDTFDCLYFSGRTQRIGTPFMIKGTTEWIVLLQKYGLPVAIKAHALY